MPEDKIKKAKRLVYIILLSVVAVVGLAVYFIVIPTINSVYTTKDEFEENKLNFEVIRQDALNAKSYSDLLVNIKNNEDLLENALVKKDKEVEFIEKIEAVANEVGNEVSIEPKEVNAKKAAATVVHQDAASIEAEKARQEREKSKVHLLITVKGSYKSFLEFMYRLENMPQIFNVESVIVDKGTAVKSLFSNSDIPSNYTEGKILISFIPVSS